nr:trimethyllysine dioxygenase, mitochondrial [Microcebus murinus]
MCFDYVWLQDNCCSASCYNSKTHQHSMDIASVDLCIKPKTIRLDETMLFFTWLDGHVTRYNLDWLVKNSYEGQKQNVIRPRILWNAEIYREAQVPSVDFQGFLETNKGFKKLLQNFLLYGIAFVENIPPTRDHTEKLAKRISLISIKVFHCLKHEGTRGRTLLVNGFYAAEQVLQKASEEFELLSKVPLKHEYIENVGECHNHMIGIGPILNIYPWNKELYLIRCLLEFTKEALWTRSSLCGKALDIKFKFSIEEMPEWALVPAARRAVAVLGPSHTLNCGSCVLWRTHHVPCSSLLSTRLSPVLPLLTNFRHLLAYVEVELCVGGVVSQHRNSIENPQRFIAELSKKEKKQGDREIRSHFLESAKQTIGHMGGRRPNGPGSEVGSDPQENSLLPHRPPHPPIQGPV